MKIEQRGIDDIVPYENNPRLNDDAVDKVAMSLEQYGWQQPIVVDADGVIIVGHTRLKAAKQLGYEQCPVVVADGLSPAQVKAYRIADNKTGELAEWDEDLLNLEIKGLMDLNFDVSLTGFDLDDFNQTSEHYEPQDSPEDFKEYGDDIETEYRCPKCGYEWSGKPK